MKVTLRLPTNDQYAYLEADVEVFNIEQALTEYERIMRLIKGGEGLDEKEFNSFIDAQLMGESNHIDQYEKASAEQKKFIQILKRALKRIEARQAKK